MTWYAKPKSYYTMGSTEGTANILEIWSYLQGQGYTIEAASGVVGNVYGESGLNPWRWQGDRVGQSRGYGLYQYTPASGYLALSGVTPNMSVSQQTAGATPEDGLRQTQCFATNELSKWVPAAWRSYWDTTQYASLYAKRAQWLQTWGNGSSITMAQFKVCTDIEAATFFVLACFEGPSIPALADRYNYALNAYNIIGGSEPTPPPPPPTPPPPPPTPPTPPHPPFALKQWLLMALKNARDNKRSANI